MEKDNIHLIKDQIGKLEHLLATDSYGTAIEMSKLKSWAGIAWETPDGVVIYVPGVPLEMLKA